MKKKILNLCLVLTSLLGYLEWGGGNHMLLAQGEADIIGKLFSDPLAALHPFTVLPLLGQILLLATLFQKEPGKWLTYIGMGCIGLLLLLIFFIGAMGLNLKMLLSALPFLIVSTLVIRNNRKPKETT